MSTHGKINVFVKPDEQCRACLNIAMARKRTFRKREKNVFVKPNEQCRACSNIVMARKRTFRKREKNDYSQTELLLENCC